MTQQTVKRLIKKKFGSISEFSRQSGMERNELQSLLNNTPFNKKKLSEVHGKVSKLVPQLPVDYITPAKLDRLKRAVDKAGGVITFCNANPSFSKDSLFHILSGRRKMESKTVKRLFALLGI